MGDILKILQVINILAPHLGHLISIIRKESGDVDIVISLDKSDVRFQETLDLIAKWKASHPV